MMISRPANGASRPVDSSHRCNASLQCSPILTRSEAMSTIQWFTMEYDAPNRGRIKLVNLQAAGCDDIERAQRGLGSVNFERTPQTHHYHWLEVELRRSANPAREQGERPDAPPRIPAAVMRNAHNEGAEGRIPNVDPQRPAEPGELAHPSRKDEVQPNAVVESETIAPK